MQIQKGGAPPENVQASAEGLVADRGEGAAMALPVIVSAQHITIVISRPNTPPAPPSRAVVTAVIGAAGLIAAAIVAGIFAVLAQLVPMLSQHLLRH